MKKLLLFIGLFFISLTIVQAEEVVVDNDVDLKNIFNSGGEVKLGSDITLNANTGVNNDTVLDLNGYSLIMNGKTLIPYGNLTVKDTSVSKSGKITGTSTYVIQVGSSTKNGKLTLESGTIDCSAKNYCVTIPALGELTVNGGRIIAKLFPVVVSGNLVVNGGVIESPDDVLYGNTNGVITINNGLIKTTGDFEAICLSKPGSKLVMNGGVIDASESPNKNSVGIIGFKNTELIINDGEIIATGAAIMGNGSVSGNSEGSNAKFTINGGNIVATKGLGIYAPQPNGEVLITGGTITGNTSAIEIRAGKLTITGGVFNGNNELYQIDPNSNGSNTTGSAVSVIQHTTKLPIEVNIMGGTFNANTPISEANPMNNSPEDLAKITINIADGLFNSTGEKTVDIQDITGDIITGGTYTKNVTEYINEELYGERDNGDSVTVLPYRNVAAVEGTDQSIIDNQRPLPGEEVVITPVDKEGYTAKVVVKDKDGNNIELKNNTFIMVDGDVTVEVSYRYNYRIIDGADQTFNSKDIIIKTNGELSNLDRIEINGKVLDKANYLLDEGSTILSLKKEYLKTLKPGVYNIFFVYNDGEVGTTFTIKNNSINPNTSDNIMIYFMILGISFIGLISTVICSNKIVLHKKFDIEII